MDNKNIKVPSNHKFNERKLIAYIHTGEWAINSMGEIWKLKERKGANGKFVFKDIEPIRAEKCPVKIQYLTVRGSIDGKRYSGFAHRLVWQYFHGDIPDGLTINHKDGNKINNHPDNLELATYTEQSKHCYHVLKKRSQVGEKNNSSKLKDDDVKKIIELYETKKYTQLEIANMFGIVHQHVSRLINGERRYYGEKNIKFDHRNCTGYARDEKGRFLKKQK